MSDTEGELAEQVLTRLGYVYRIGEWVSPLEAVTDELYDVVNDFAERAAAEPTATAELGERVRSIAAYLTTRWPDGRSPVARLFKLEGENPRRELAVKRLRESGYTFTDAAWMPPAFSIEPRIQDAADAMAKIISIEMMQSAGEVGPDIPFVLGLEELLGRFEKVRFTPEEIAAAKAADPNNTYLDFLRTGEMKRRATPPR